jgi:hypothetical protein
MTSKEKSQPAKHRMDEKHKRPRGEQLLDRIDKNPDDREAWNELAGISTKRAVKKKRPAR